jgi:hypothetical protein
MPLLPGEIDATKVNDWRKDPHAIEKFRHIYHFLPHPERKSRATFLTNTSLLSYCLLLVFSLFLFKMTPKVMPGVLGYASNITTRDLLEYTNKRRDTAGLSPLRLNPELTEAAKKKAAHMFEKGYWAHVSPDGTEPWDFILGEKYDYIYAGENLAKNFSNSREVVQAWYDSPSHRDNLMSPNYDEVGFAVVNGVLDGYETTLVVQMFGRPRNPSLIASEQVQRDLLDEAARTQVVSEEANPDYQAPKVTNNSSNILPAVDVHSATKGITMVIGSFVTVLLAADIWYSRKKGIFKFTGHTIAHLMFLIVTMLSIWLVLKPGIIL